MRSMWPLVLLGGLALAACKDEPVTPPVPVPATPIPAPVVSLEPVTSTRTIVVAGVAGTPAPTPEPTTAPEPSAAGPACPGWAGQARCTVGDQVYASAAVKGIADKNLAKTTASNRARAALLGGDKGNVAGGEIAAVETCGPQTWALARVPATAIPAATLPSCTFTAP